MGLRIFFLPNFAGAMFIPDSRVSTYVLVCFWQHQHRDEGYIQWQWQTAASKARKSQISALRLLVLSLAGHAVRTAVRRANHGLNFAAVRQRWRGVGRPEGAAVSF